MSNAAIHRARSTQLIPALHTKISPTMNSSCTLISYCFISGGSGVDTSKNGISSASLLLFRLFVCFVVLSFAKLHGNVGSYEISDFLRRA